MTVLNSYRPIGTRVTQILSRSSWSLRCLPSPNCDKNQITRKFASCAMTKKKVITHKFVVRTIVIKMWLYINLLFYFLIFCRCSPGAGPLKVLVLGDSLTKYLERDIHDITKDLSTKVICKRGASVKSLQSSVRDTLSYNPDVVFIHVGTNKLHDQLTTITCGEFERLTLTVCALYPTSQVIINNILPRYDSSDLHDAAKHLNF